MERKELIKGVVGGLAFLLVLCLASCSPRIIREVETVKETVYKDSIAWRDTVLKVPIPLEKDQAIVRLGDTSRLETSVAESVAYITQNGELRHELKNKRGHLSVVEKIPVRYIFNGVTTSQKETVYKTVYRDKPLSWWQSLKIRAFWWLLGAVAALLLWTFRKLLF